LQGLVRTGGRLSLSRMVDTDRNGLPDWWEQSSFGLPAGADPDADLDADGASNWAEWMAGTDPTNASSRLHLTTLSAQGTNGLEIRWQSVPGKFYRLERSTNIATGFAATIRTNVPATAPLNTETDTTATGDGPYFYRVGVQ